MTQFLVMLAAGAVIVGFLFWIGERDARSHARITAWMAANECKRTGFAGRYAEPVYTCKDGLAYTGREIRDAAFGR